jgi:hypothetical protein
MTAIDLDARKITAQIDGIVRRLEKAPNLFRDMRMTVPERLACIANQIMPNYLGRLEDHCMYLLAQQKFQNTQRGLIENWYEHGIIDVDQAVFMVTTCGIDPRELGR